MKLLSALLLGSLALTSCGELGGLGSGLGDSETVAGLREALTIGTQNTVQTLSKQNAYYQNDPIKIPFPPDARQVETTLRSIGFGSLVDQVVLSLNRAAEDAAIKAKPIFLNAILNLTFQDAYKILHGQRDEATQFLKANTHAQLMTAFRPDIQTSLDKVQATRYWGQAMDTYNQVPFVEKIDPDLTAFVTRRALDGVFYWLAKEEEQIRTNPSARVTDLLRRVFGPNAAR